MAGVRAGRFTDTHDGPLVVFLIGMRINSVLSIDKWLPVARAMPRMLRELMPHPEMGLLGYELALAPMRTLMTIQYWRDFESLHRYAHAAEHEHLPAWRAFNRASKDNAAVGIFHETYVVGAGAHESIYAAMPPFGLGKAAGMTAATGQREKARDRITAARPS